MEEKLVQYKMWLNAEITNASKKILDANKKGHNSDASYWKGMLNGLERYTKKLTDLKLSEHKKEILNEITKMEKEISQSNGNMISFLEGVTDALERCLEKIED
jgi:Zn-dependent M16 (insulinase) family peptidase